jgi:hypothetical protein
MIMFKLVAAASSVLLSLGLAALFQPPPCDGLSPPPPRAKGKVEGKKKKGAPEPGGELRKSYDLLRRIRADSSATGRTEERLREWTDRATMFYREGLKALGASDALGAREYGAAAHDLARAVDHARNASRFDRPDPDLPAPSGDFGLEDIRERARHDLDRAYERIQWLASWQTAGGTDFYAKAARDLYSAGRRDLEAGRDERGGELARAAEAMTHVPEHLTRGGEGRGRVETRSAPEPPRDRPEPKAKDALAPPDRRSLDLPPKLPPDE